MTARSTAPAVEGGRALGLIVGLFLAVALLVGAWLAIADGRGRPSITVNDHTDNAVPLTDRSATQLRVDA